MPKAEITIKADLPKVLTFPDYHDIQDLQYRLKKFTNDLKVFEVGCVHGVYHAIVYAGKKSSPEVKKMTDDVEEYLDFESRQK